MPRGRAAGRGRPGSSRVPVRTMGRAMFGEHLVRKGLLSNEQLLEILEQQEGSRLPLGRLAFREELMTLDQVVEVLEAQAAGHKLFGEIAVEKGYLAPEQRDLLVRLQQSTSVPLAQLLVESGLLDIEVAEREFDEYHEKRGEPAP